jgi:hypothetical protein
VDALLRVLPQTAALCVFQYRPQGQSWAAVFERIEAGLPEGTEAHSIHDGQLAFVFLASATASERVQTVLEGYSENRQLLRRRAFRAT